MFGEQFFKEFFPFNMPEDPQTHRQIDKDFQNKGTLANEIYTEITE